MGNAKKTALIAGATGLVGNELLHILLKQSKYERVIVITRRRLNATHPKLHQIVVDFDHLDHYQSDLSVDDVYCCLGTTIKKAGSQAEFKKVDFTYPLELARLTKENGAEKFLIITAMGAQLDSKIFYNRVKGEIEAAIKGVGFPTVHIFRPSLLLGNRQEFRFGEKIGTILSPALSALLIGSLKKYKPIHARDVASAMYQASELTGTGVFTHESDEIQRISKTS
ncbi:Uncharacterized conserved protein YbjT, contains NAD(P)-binding and DUF2867 domains [Mesobacillus persicus]|uniref:Uncharacterized conserved protein YbjT, contains NAD(P)-binding and DUF2867 domains n=1 Tax=Mesobacillus persicus TaxID=930146 RepID=A0A1H8KRV3_9BACI|nr:oxidoreductase [Mesobacillus persicus]SEN95619.1 Uncharacterized conserved protein YbjT, contains NAD(P)-binding and DUF2867 domains [Mesobacillus persicus]